MNENEQKPERKSRGNWITKGIVALIALGLVYMILKIAPNYKDEEIKDRINVIINNNNITNYLKKDAFVDNNGNIYMSKQDVDNFFDNYITYDEKYNQIITTYEDNIAALVVGNNEMELNSSKVKISAPVIEKDETYYIPMSEMQKVYNMEIEFVKETGIITIDSIDRKQVKADSSKNLSLKSRTKVLSRTLDRIKKGEKIIVIENLESGWAKVRSERGKIGYLKQKDIINETVVRENVEKASLEKVSIVWDYYSEYYKAPDRSGQKIEGINVVSPSFFVLKRLGEGEIIDKAGEEGIAYVNWAKSNGYKVWGMFANDAMIETTSQIMRDYKLREKTINGIVDLAVKYNLDGINLDFENMYQEDKNLFTRFVVELYPRLKKVGKTLSVDVTAPDGGETWSLCFDRINIAQNTDYIVFMAYDQYGESSVKAGPTAAYDWVEVSLKKFVVRDEIDNNKVILAIPFYTRIWREYPDASVKSSTVDMKNVNNALNQYFSGVQKIWDEDRKLYYVEKQASGFIYKMWIEDERSIQEKLNMAEQYKLGGVAFWEKDMEDENIWKNINEYFKKPIEKE